MLERWNNHTNRGWNCPPICCHSLAVTINPQYQPNGCLFAGQLCSHAAFPGCGQRGPELCRTDSIPSEYRISIANSCENSVTVSKYAVCRSWRKKHKSFDILQQTYHVKPCFYKVKNGGTGWLDNFKGSLIFYKKNVNFILKILVQNAMVLAAVIIEKLNYFTPLNNLLQIIGLAAKFKKRK